MEIVVMQPEKVEARRLAGERMHFVDVRSPGEFQQVHVTGALLYPLDGLQPKKIAAE